MSTLEDAIARLGNAITDLEDAFEALEAREANGEEIAIAPELRDERDKLADEVHALRARAAEDAELRAEAAVAVREALNDLRGVVQHGASGHA